MKSINEIYQRENHPIRFVQIGEGNFLRAFVDYAIDVANEDKGFDSSVAVVIPINFNNDRFAKQDNLYTVALRGQKEGQPFKENRVIKCIDRVINSYADYDEFMSLAHIDTLQYVVSNTTEAGIAYDASNKFEDCPPATFPAKLTKFLYERFTYYKGAADKGLAMLPVELIDHNGETLNEYVLKYAEQWKLGQDFIDWLNNSCIFASTLVDRIVTGYPRNEAEAICQELGYNDILLDQGEPFGLWVIGDSRLSERLAPLNSEKISVVFTDEIERYKQQKVRILNGAHTSMVLGAYLAGFDYVGQCMKDKALNTQLQQSVFMEIVPTVNMSEEKCKEFAAAVFERFANPFVNHALLSISLNSISKWRARCLPTFKDCIKANGSLPKWLTYSFAALLAFYRTSEKGEGCLIGKRATGNTYEIKDDQDKLEFIAGVAGKPTAEYVNAVMTQAAWWGEDLTAIEGFEAAVVKHLSRIDEVGAKAHIEEMAAE